MKKSIVCLSFDLDALSLWIARGIKTPTALSRGEFAVVGARRILRLLSEFDIKTTWFIPGHTLETFPELCEEVLKGGHEIGHHGWSHVSPVNLPVEEEEAGLVRANELIRQLAGHYAKGYRSPAWDLSPNSVELLLKHGFAYDSSMMANDYTPYYVRRDDIVPDNERAIFGTETDLLEMPVSWSLDDFPHFEFTRTSTTTLPGLMNANAVLDNWVEDYLYMHETMDWGVITYTFHPEVIGRGHRMRMLRRLIERLAENSASFQTIGEVAEHCRR